MDQHAPDGRDWTDEEVLSLRLAAGLFGLALGRQSADERLRFHFDNAPMAAIEWDADFVVRRWSRAAAELFGWSAAQVVGRALYDWPLVHEDDAAQVEQTIRRLMEGGRGHQIAQNRNRRRDGTTFVCQWINSVQRDPQGHVVSVFSFAQDVTERERAARDLGEANAGLEAAVAQRTRALAETERRYRRLAEHATDMISAHDVGGPVCIYVSPACRDLLGYAPRRIGR